MNLPDKIAKWIKERVETANAKGIVMGLSGGMDSSVVAVLAKKAVGGNLLCVIMPCNSSESDVDDAHFIADEFKIKTVSVDLSGLYKSYIGILPQGDKIARANLIPRLRMATLYYFANTHNYLVAGTGNKSEIMTGYYTKYGDGGVDILPVGDLLKTEIKKLAVELGIPERIMKKVPSAGLWDGQTDEGELGITYDELDRTLLAIEKNDVGRIPPENLEKVKKIIDSSKHKREAIPIYKIER